MTARNYTNPASGASETELIAIAASKVTKPTFSTRFMEQEQPWLAPTVFVSFVLLWEYGTQLLNVSTAVLPRPSVIVVSLFKKLGDPVFWEAVGATTQAALSGFFIAGFVALVIGTAVSQLPLIERIVMPYIVAFQAVPKVALAPLFVVWFGFGLASKVMMAAVIAFFPMLINIIEGLKSAEPDRIQMLRVFGASKMQIFRMVRLPSATPFIFAGLEMGLVFSILGAVVGEFIGAQKGLGVLLLQANYNFDVPGMFAVLLVLSAMGLSAHLGLGFIQKRVAFWAEESRVITA